MDDAKKATSSEHQSNRAHEEKLETPSVNNSFLEKRMRSSTNKITQIFVAKIASSVTESAFQSYFANHGDITDLYMPKDPATKDHFGIGFITFASSESVDNLMNNTHKLGGSTVFVDRAMTKEDDFCRVPHGGRGGYGACNAYNSSATRYAALEKPIGGTCRRIFVGRLPQEATVDDLHQYFSKFGRIWDVYIPKDRKRAESRRFGFVTFAEDGVADRVASRPHQILGQSVSISSATPVDEAGPSGALLMDNPVMFGSYGPLRGGGLLDNHVPFGSYGPLRGGGLLMENSVPFGCYPVHEGVPFINNHVPFGSYGPLHSSYGRMHTSLDFDDWGVGYGLRCPRLGYGLRCPRPSKAVNQRLFQECDEIYKLKTQLKSAHTEIEKLKKELMVKEKEMVTLKEAARKAETELGLFRNLLMRLSEKSQTGESTIAPMNNNKTPVQVISKSDYANKKNGDVQISGQSNSLKPVQYNASPTKAAEIERQSFLGSDDSSFSSKDDQPSAAERSQTLIRSESPRRSASPKRKVQIGRSGSRRTPALTIRSLPYFPARERISPDRDTGNGCKSEESEEPNKKTGINVTMMSVQYAIGLFESKQRDQTVESQKKAKVKLDTVPGSENQEFEETVKIDMGLEESKNNVLSEDEASVHQSEEIYKKLDSAEWNGQKEEELNKMLMKYVEPDSIKKCIARLGQSGGLNGLHKKKRDEKLSGDKSNSGKTMKRKTMPAPEEDAAAAASAASASKAVVQTMESSPVKNQIQQ